MGRLVGMDEAGYGPNLGPLVVAATVWDIPGDPAEFDGWAEFEIVLGLSLIHISEPTRPY